MVLSLLLIFVIWHLILETLFNHTILPNRYRCMIWIHIRPDWSWCGAIFSQFLSVVSGIFGIVSWTQFHRLMINRGEFNFVQLSLFFHSIVVFGLNFCWFSEIFCCQKLQRHLCLVAAAAISGVGGGNSCGSRCFVRCQRLWWHCLVEVTVDASIVGCRGIFVMWQWQRPSFVGWCSGTPTTTFSMLERKSWMVVEVS